MSERASVTAQPQRAAQPAARGRPAPALKAAPAPRDGRAAAHTTRDRLAAAFAGDAAVALAGAELADAAEPSALEPAGAREPADGLEPAIALEPADALEPAPAPAPAGVLEPAHAREPAPAPEPATARGADRQSGAPADTAWGTRARIAQRAQALAGAGAGTDVADPAAAEPVAITAHTARPGEAAATPVPPEPHPDLELELELEQDAATTAAPGATRRRRRARAGASAAGAAAAGPRTPNRRWAPPPRALIRIDPAPGRARVPQAPVRPVVAHARGPPHAGGTTPTPTTPAELAAAHERPEVLLRAVVAVHGDVPVVQAKLAVSTPGDPFEREADAVAERVMHGTTPNPPAAGVIAGRLQRAPPHARGPPQAGLPGSVTGALQSGGGRPLDATLRRRIEPHVGLDLGHVRVRDEPAAARDLGARAFTSGATIFLAAGSSASDVALMAHEATHVAQQAASPVASATLQRLDAADLIPDWILDSVRSAVRALPGYELLSTIAGEDLLTGEPARQSRDELVEKVLTYGPFGAAVGPLLATIDVLGDVFAVITEGLAANDLTLARIGRDIETAWDEFSVTNGVSGNLAIVERLIRALLRDVASFVSSIVDRVIELVRAIVAKVAEPLLETPQIKPIWDLTKKVLHYDPLRGEDVEAPTVDIIADFLRLIGQEERLAQMQERGTLQETADWLDTQFETFAGLVSELGTLFSDAWAAIQPANLPNLLTNLESLAGRAFDLVQRVGEFGATLILKILELVKDSLLGFLSEHAHAIPGFRLLTVILEQDPFTGERVERTARNLIRGFITLLPGGEATFDQLAESGVIDEAAERIESAMARLGISVELITGLFLGIWDTLSLDDLLDPLGAFERIIALFGDTLARLVEFVIVVIEVIVTLVLRLMNFPTELLGRVIASATQAIDDIAADPVGFLLHMLEAIKLGFSSFLDHILSHLAQGLASWLFRGLGALGIERPPDYSLGSILNLVFQVLGLTVEHLWEKLGQHIGPERVAMIRGALDMLGSAWAFIVEVQRDGLAAIWRFISDQLGNLWSTLVQMATEWIMTRVISAVTTRLLSLLDPTGIMAVVNSAIALFNAIQSAIEYFREMLEIVAGYVDTLAAVAAGNVAPGAQMLEQGLANAVPIAIGFLAQQVGLGNIPEKVVEIIGRLREPVDRALDWLIAGALRLGRAALDALGLGQRPAQPEQPPGAAPGEVVFEVDGVRHRLFREGADPAHATAMINPDPRRTVAAELDALAARVETDLPIPADKIAARAAVQGARTILGAAAPAGAPLADLEPHLRLLYSKLGHPDVPETHVEGHDASMGVRVTAGPLTRKAGNTQGSSSTAGAHVDQRNDIARLNAGAGLSAKGHASIEWVAAHMLSARLHGPSTAGNFTPTSQRDNGVLLRGVEQPAIDLLAADEGRNMLWWEATVTPSSDAALPHWADTLRITYGRWDAATSGRGAQLGQAEAHPRPDFRGARSIGSLSEDGQVRLTAVTGMDSTVARTIVAVREARLPGGGRFQSWGHVTDLVMTTPRTAGGALTPTSAATTLAELDRVRDRIVPHFGFDPDADLRRYLAYLASV